MKVGDKVIWKKDDEMYSAKKGATAVIYDVDEYKSIIRVKWDTDNPLHNSQSDGGYYTDYFELLYPDKQEGLFKPGDRVLVRDENYEEWQPRIFIGMNPADEYKYKYIVIDEDGYIHKLDGFKQCKHIPKYSKKQIGFFKKALEKSGYTVTK